jgi:translation initiation factor 4E
VATFDMVEDFWGIFNNIRPPSRLNPGSNYHLFKTGIEPTWEHKENKNGGKWNYWWVLNCRASRYPLSSAAARFTRVLSFSLLRVCVSCCGCSIPKKDGKKVIDDMWLYTILAMIGENFDAGHDLCGAVIRCAPLLARCCHLPADSTCCGRPPFPPRPSLRWASAHGVLY